MQIQVAMSLYDKLYYFCPFNSNCNLGHTDNCSINLDFIPTDMRYKPTMLQILGNYSI